MAKTMTETNSAGSRPKLQKMSVYQVQEADKRRRFFIEHPPAGTTQHDLVNPAFWKAIREELQRHDIVTVLCDGDDGDTQRWEMIMNVESVTPDVTVSLRQRIDRKPLSTDITRLDSGEYIQWYAGEDGRHKAYTVFRADGQPTPITGHITIGAARNQWSREQARKAA